MKSLQYLPLLFEPKIDCLLHTEIRFLESKSTLPQRKKSTTFRRGIPDFRQNNRKLGGNIGDSKSTFIQDSENIGKKNTFFGCS